MDEDKAAEYLGDARAEGMSNCCGSTMYEMGDNYICGDCKEWCELAKEEELVADRAFSTEQLAYIARCEKECGDAGCDDNGHKHD